MAINNGVSRKVFLALAVCLAGFGAVSAPAATSFTIYSTLPATLPTDFDFSLAYEAQATNEFGMLIQPDGSSGATNLVSATVGFDNFSGTAFSLPVTLTLYNVGPGNSVGSVIASSTTTADFTSAGAQLVNFALPNIAWPSQFIFGVSFNTQDYGPNPTGVSGPADSLNLGFVFAPPLIGTNFLYDTNSPLYDTGYYNSPVASQYADGGTAGVGVLRQDTGWSQFGSPAISFDATATPEPATLGLIGLGLVGLAVLRRRNTPRI